MARGARPAAGAWATRHLRLGMRCGRARCHPGEGLGAYDTAAILREDAEERLREYYYGLLEDQERALGLERRGGRSSAPSRSSTSSARRRR